MNLPKLYSLLLVASTLIISACAVESPDAGEEGNTTAAANALVLMEQAGGSTMVSEGGQPDTLDVRLTVEPEATVSISFADPQGQLVLSPSVVQFTASNYHNKQTVSVSAVDDVLVEGNHSALISIAVTAGDANYRLLSIAGISVDIADNDSPGVSIVETGGNTTVSESGTYDTYQIALTREPSADVYIQPISPNPNQLTVAPTELIFTPNNWAAPQSVTVVAVDDPGIEETDTYKISHSVSSADGGYNGLSMGKVNAVVTDNDRIVYVNKLASGLDNGQSWSNAYEELSDALAAAVPGQEIWIAAGTYKPGNTRTSIFELVSNIKIYGGFNGTETAKGQRDWEINETILSGDISGNDAAPHTGYGDNSYHIMRAINVSGTTIDGLIFEGGNADGSTNYEDVGGALISFNSNLTLNRLTIRYNVAHTAGGGLYFNGGTDISILNAEFIDNRATDGASSGIGGAIYIKEVDGLTVNQSEFSANQAYNLSGAIHLQVSSNIVYRNSIFSTNKTLNNDAGLGGTGSVTYSSTVTGFTIDGCTFEYNTAADNAAVFGTVTYDWSIVDSIFKQNTGAEATDGGGAVRYWASSIGASIDNTVFEGNQTAGGGGAIYSEADGLTITNSTFDGNSAAGEAGAVYLDGVSNITITGSDFMDNESGISGGALRLVNVNGFNMTGGSHSGNSADIFGGAILASGGGDYTLTDIDFSGNYTVSDDSGLPGTGSVAYFSTLDDIVIDNNTFTNNVAADNSVLFGTTIDGWLIKDSTFTGNNSTGSGSDSGGGAVHLWGSVTNTTIKRTTFEGNYANTIGGAILNKGSNLTIDRCMFLGNSAALDGGALQHELGLNLVVTNSIFSQNLARRGAAMFIFANGGNTTARIENNTVAFNHTFVTTTQHGAVIIAKAGSDTADVDLHNNIIHHNVGRYGTQPGFSNLQLLSGTLIDTYNIIEGGVVADNNITDDPEFIFAPKSVSMTGDSSDGDSTFTTGTTTFELQACVGGVPVAGEFLEYNRDGVAREIASVSCPTVTLVAEDALPEAAGQGKLITFWGSAAPAAMDLRPAAAAALDSGDNSYPGTAKDYAGSNRQQGGVVDRGAYEVQ